MRISLNMSTETFGFIILFMFIHNSNSNNGHMTTASKLLKHRSSAGCVGEFLQACFVHARADDNPVVGVLKEFLGGDVSLGPWDP